MWILCPSWLCAFASHTNHNNTEGCGLHHPPLYTAYSIGYDLTVLPACSSVCVCEIVSVCVRVRETQHIKRYCLAGSHSVDAEWKSRLLQECVKASVCMCSLWPWPLHSLYENYSSTNTHSFHYHLKEQFTQKWQFCHYWFTHIIPNQYDSLSSVEHKRYIFK